MFQILAIVLQRRPCCLHVREGNFWTKLTLINYEKHVQSLPVTTASAAAVDTLFQNAKKVYYAKVLLKLLLLLGFLFLLCKIFFLISSFRRTNLDVCVHNVSELLLSCPSVCLSIYTHIQGRLSCSEMGHLA